MAASRAEREARRGRGELRSVFVTVADVGEIAPGNAKAFLVGDREIALFNIDGTFFAIDNTCPHQGGPLANGWIEGRTVTCPWHAWCFDLATGKMTLGPYAGVDAFEVRIDGSKISVSSEPRT
jgi:nitrite reductase/ring-hydroxylating ferredoxin subunit